MIGFIWYWYRLYNNKIWLNKTANSYWNCKKETFQKNVKYVILGCIIFGIIIEILQGVVTSYRTASYLDIVANTIGVLLAVVIFHVFEKKISVF